MSAYMVADETINRVVRWLNREVYQSSFLKEKVEKTLAITTGSEAWADTVGKAMFQLNIDGVNDRYGDGEAKKFRKLNYTYVPAQPTTIYNVSTKIQVLKSLQCWLYQSMEGEVVKKPFYIFFRTVVEPHLMSGIIADLPDYQEAEWG